MKLWICSCKKKKSNQVCMHGWNCMMRPFKSLKLVQVFLYSLVQHPATGPYLQLVNNVMWLCAVQTQDVWAIHRKSWYIYCELEGILEGIFSCCIYHWGQKRTLMSLHLIFSAWCDRFRLLDYFFWFLNYSELQFAAVSSHWWCAATSFLLIWIWKVANSYMLHL